MPWRWFQTNQNDATAYAVRGMCHLGNGELAAAVVEASQSIRIEPQSIDGYGVRCGVELRLGEQNLAIADLTEVIKLDPKNVNAYVSRSAAYISKSCQAISARPMRGDAISGQGSSTSGCPAGWNILRGRSPTRSLPLSLTPRA